MYSSHEYSVIGHSRVAIGRYLGVIAGLLSSLLATIIASFIALAVEHGMVGSKDFLLLPITSAIFYGIGYFIFDRWAWKISVIQKFLGVPYISGVWSCVGQTLDPTDGRILFNWTADITIVQRWEKISVCIETNNSRSHSVAVSIIKKEDGGAILMYSYRNEPKPGEPELKPHWGYSEWHFSSDMLSAEALYVNGGGRITSGRMNISRKEKVKSG